MRLPIHRVLALALALPLLLEAQESGALGRMLRTGEFHGDEVSARTGQRWLALVIRPDGHDAVSSVTLRVDAVKDEMVDEGDAKSGKRVSIGRKSGDGTFLLRGVPEIKPGKVKTISSVQSLQPNTPINLTLSPKRNYRLVMICPPPVITGDEGRTSASLVLQLGDQQQTLATFDTASYFKNEFQGVGNSGEIRVMWAGDLNGDGALDLIVDLTDHYNVSLPTLFLGNKKGSKNLVSRVAQHRSVGC